MPQDTSSPTHLAPHAHLPEAVRLQLELELALGLDPQLADQRAQVLTERWTLGLG